MKDGKVNFETKRRLPTFAVLSSPYVYLSLSLSLSLYLPPFLYLSISSLLSWSCPMLAASVSPPLYFVIAVSAAAMPPSFSLPRPPPLLSISHARAVVAPSSEDAEEISYSADDSVVVYMSVRGRMGTNPPSAWSDAEAEGRCALL